MLVVSNISKSFPGAEAPILKDVSLIVNAGERVALIGPNGSGKSTLIRIIVGQETADSGSVQFSPPNLRVGYLSQGLAISDDQPIRVALFPQLGALQQAEADVEQYAAKLATDSSASVLDTYATALERYEQLSDAIDFNRGEQLLASLHLGQFTLDAPVGALSGGQKTRLGLAAVLANDPQLLILDEPTNHLDVTALEWLEAWLQGFRGGALIVSHDRTFLDNTVNRVVAIDPKTHTAKLYEGGYSDYVYTVHSEIDKQWALWRDQQVEIERLKLDARRTMEQSQKSEAKGGDRLAKKTAKKAHAKESRLERYLASDDLVEKPKLGWNLKLDFGDLPTGGQDVLSTTDLAVGYDPAHPLLTNLNLSVRSGERIAIVGPNGHGKSTLLKTLIGQLEPLAGRVRLGASVQVGYLAQEQEILDPALNATETVMTALPSLNETEARSFLHLFLFTRDDAVRPVGLLSFGERVRLMLAVLVARGSNFLVLDEPVNHLDVPSRERFELALSTFRGSVLAVVHDRYFVEKFASTVWHVQAGSLTEEVKVSEPVAVDKKAK